MDIPSSITDILENLDIRYDIEQSDSDLLISRLHRANSNLTQLARVSVLRTRSGKIQLITSANALCRLDKVINELGEPVDALHPEQEHRLVAARSAENFNAVPQTSNYRVLVDACLFTAQQLYLPAGIKDIYLLISGGDFKRLVQGYQIINADLPLDELQYNLTRPECDEDQLHLAVRNYTSRKIAKQLTETLDIPPLSHTAQRVLSLSANPHAEAEELVAIVEQDPSLAAQVVGWAASPYYSPPGKVTSIHDAVIRVLGFELVMSLAVGLAVGKTLKIPKDCPWGASAFWRQSIYCAIAMEKLNSRLPAPIRGSSGLCYITGLLNNFGYLIMAHVFKEHFTDLCRYQEANRHLPAYLIESYLLGISRDQMSSQLMQYWNLPDEVCTALRFQQHPDYRGDHHIYANLCFIAQRLLAAKGIGQSPHSFIPVDLYNVLGLTPSVIEQTVEDIFSSAVEIDAMTSVFVN